MPMPAANTSSSSHRSSTSPCSAGLRCSSAKERSGEKQFMKWKKVFFALALCAASARGGEPGSRLAGSSKELQLVRDLRAVRKGDKVTLTWSQPRDTENGQSFAGHLAVARVCRNISATISDPGLACSQVVRQVNFERSVGVAASAAHGKPNAETTVRLIDILLKAATTLITCSLLSIKLSFGMIVDADQDSLILSLYPWRRFCLPKACIPIWILVGYT